MPVETRTAEAQIPQTAFTFSHIYGSINGAKTPVPLVCDDYSHEVTLGESWSFVENTLATLSNTRWGTADQLQYEEAFWLISQVPSHSSDIAGIQFAIWKLFDKSTPDISDEDYWLSAANTAELNDGATGKGMIAPNAQLTMYGSTAPNAAPMTAAKSATSSICVQ